MTRVTLAAFLVTGLAGCDHRLEGGTPALAKDRYLLKVYVDAGDRLAADWKAVLGEGDYAGQVEIASDWPSRYGKMAAADASRVKM